MPVLLFSRSLKIGVNLAFVLTPNLSQLLNLAGEPDLRTFSNITIHLIISALCPIIFFQISGKHYRSDMKYGTVSGGIIHCFRKIDHSWIFAMRDNVA